nr:hypothetical protein [Chitinophagaceae bacterium]
MVSVIREAFNAQFTAEKYQAYLDELNGLHPGEIQFRVAETPIFVDEEFTGKIIEACESIVDVILKPDFKAMTEAAIPADIWMPGENEHTEFIAFDFGICNNGRGGLEPQLIEMQGFPSLFAYQIWHTAVTKKHFPPPAGFDAYLNGYTEETYVNMLRDVVIGQYDPNEVILLEVYPEEQKTRIDFWCTRDYIGIETVCITKLKADGNNLYYDKNGLKQAVKRIYNRVIFDDLQQQQLPEGTIDLKKPWNVEWCPHPHWFYRISKYTLPFINSPYVPKTVFLSDVETIPDDLENYVLKPLFSFAGQGVVIDVTPADITVITDRHNWILQRKVQYAEAITTPDEPAKGEIRIFYFWPKGAARPFAAQNLARLSKGKMIGVRYNKDKEWVGGSL